MRGEIDLHFAQILQQWIRSSGSRKAGQKEAQKNKVVDSHFGLKEDSNAQEKIQE